MCGWKRTLLIGLALFVVTIMMAAPFILAVWINWEWIELRLFG